MLAFVQLQVVLADKATAAVLTQIWFVPNVRLYVRATQVLRDVGLEAHPTPIWLVC